MIALIRAVIKPALYQYACQLLFSKIELNSIIFLESMEEQVESSLLTNERQLIRQLLLRNFSFAELEYALTPDQFHTLVSACQMVRVKAMGVYELKTTCIYYFLVEGTLTNKRGARDMQLPSSKLSLKRRKNSELLDSKTGLFSTEMVERGAATPIEHFLETSKRSFALFSPTHKNGILLKIPAQNCELVLPAIKNYLNVKSKFINRFNIFSSLRLNQIQAHLDKFRFCSYIFNELIYDKDNHKHAYFIFNGEVLVESASHSKRLILEAPNIIGYQKHSEDERAKCATQGCILFRLDNNSLEQILTQQEEAGQKQRKFGSPLRRLYFQQPQLEDQEQSRNELSQMLNRKPNTQNGKKNRLRIGAQTNETKSRQLKEYFSNFMNEQYEEYSIKKSQGIDFMEQQPILYEIKPLVPKSPDFTEMNSRLRRVRIRKIIEGKTNLKKAKSTEQLLSLKSYHQQENGSPERKNKLSKTLFSNDRLSHKILKGLQARIDIKVHKKNPYLQVKCIG